MNMPTIDDLEQIHGKDYVKKLQVIANEIFDVDNEKHHVYYEQLLHLLMGQGVSNSNAAKTGFEMILTEYLVKYKIITKLNSDKLKLSRDVGQLQNTLEDLRKDETSLGKRNNQLKRSIQYLESVFTQRQEKIDELNDIISDLKQRRDELLSDISNLQNTYRAELASAKEKQHGVEDEDSQISAKDVLELKEKNVELKKENQDLSLQLKAYQNADKYFIETIRTIYKARFNTGKTITMSQNELEKFFRKYVTIQGEAKIPPTIYGIAKETGLTQKSVKALLNADYRNINSINKIIKSIKQVIKKGNWGKKVPDEISFNSEECDTTSKILQNLLNMYDEKLQQMIKGPEDQTNIEAEMLTLLDAHRMFEKQSEISRLKKKNVLK